MARQRRKKKSPTADSGTEVLCPPTAHEEALSLHPHSKPAPEAQAAHAAAAARVTRSAKSPSNAAAGLARPEAVSGMMRKSTAFMGMVLLFFIGLYTGTVIPTLQGGTDFLDRTPAPQAPAAPAAQPEPAKAAAAPAAAATQPAATPAQNMQAAQDANISAELLRQIADTEEALQENPKNAGLWTTLGNLYFDSNQPRKAISAYEQSLALVGGNADVLTDLGIMYRQDGQYEKAVQKFRAAAKADPRHENALFNLGIVLYTDLHRTKEARQAWQQLLKINPRAHAPDGNPVAELIKHLH